MSNTSGCNLRAQLASQLADALAERDSSTSTATDVSQRLTKTNRKNQMLQKQLASVNSSDKNLPIVPLQTLFRYFLTYEDKSGDFYGVRDPLLYLVIDSNSTSENSRHRRLERA